MWKQNNIIVREVLNVSGEGLIQSKNVAAVINRFCSNLQLIESAVIATV